jgi:hypothetical protein
MSSNMQTSQYNPYHHHANAQSHGPNTFPLHGHFQLVLSFPYRKLSNCDFNTDLKYLWFPNRENSDFMAKKMQLALFLFLAPCSLIKVYRRSRRLFCLHHQVARTASSGLSSPYLVSLFMLQVYYSAVILMHVIWWWPLYFTKCNAARNLAF